MLNTRHDICGRSLIRVFDIIILHEAWKNKYGKKLFENRSLKSRPTFLKLEVADLVLKCFKKSHECGWSGNRSLLCGKLELPNPRLGKGKLALILTTKSAFLQQLSKIYCLFEFWFSFEYIFLLFCSSNKYFFLKM